MTTMMLIILLVDAAATSVLEEILARAAVALITGSFVTMMETLRNASETSSCTLSAGRVLTEGGGYGGLDCWFLCHCSGPTSHCLREAVTKLFATP
ncbi:hypothetical protein A2U01_0003107 [Trifolium medium]|uniref:Secreted protein n=1 Tax=Trifolium medium TaxID=97028 RepID=A0A392M4Q2_9FABA|nr:hypothetical protein [Trifolium medium]